MDKSAERLKREVEEMASELERSIIIDQAIALVECLLRFCYGEVQERLTSPIKKLSPGGQRLF